MDKFYNVKQAAELLNVSPETLRRWDNSGKFKSLRHPINNYRAYSEEQITRLVEEMQIYPSYKQKMIVPVKIAPFVSTPYGKLFNCDALSFMKTIESNSVDLIFADPPYNIKKAEWDVFSSQQEYLEWSNSWITEAHRILKDTGSLYICGFSEILADIKWIASPLFEGCKWLIWFYRNKANLRNDWGRSHESILHFRKSKKFIFNVDEVRIPYNEHTLRYPKRTQAESSQYSSGKKREEVWEPNPLGAKPKDVFEIPTIANGSWEKYPHLTQKPVELLRKVILSSSNPNDLILDPFGGSGTTFAVAEAYKRRWLGTELEIDYCNVIKERLTDSEHLSRIFNQKDEFASKSRRKKLRGE